MGKKDKIKRYLRLTRIKRAFTARIASLFITFLVGWLVTGDIRIGLSISAIDTIIKLFIYYGHESVWENKMTKDIKQIKVEHSLNK